MTKSFLCGKPRVASVVLSSLFAGVAVAADAPQAFFINGRLNIKVSGGAGDYILQTRASESDEWTAVENLKKSGNFLQTPTQDYTGPSLWRFATTAKPDDWTYLPTISARQPLLSGTPFSNGQYNDSCTADKAFDGDPNTYYEPGSSPYYVGKDFGEPVTIASIAYIPRTGFGERVQNAWIEYADKEDFSDAQKACDFPGENASFDLHVIYLSPIKARYVRFRKDSWPNIAELEISAPGGEGTEEEADLSAVELKVLGKAEGDDYNPVFTWIPVNAPVVLKSAGGADGPWETVAEIDALVATCECRDAPIGQLRYYRLESGIYQSAVVTARRLRRIPMTNAKISWQGNATAWGDHPGDLAFDGNTSTFPDIDYGSKRPKLVIGFGETGATNHIAQMLLFPRDHDTYYKRTGGVNLYGSAFTAEEEVATDNLAARLTPNPSPAAQRGYWADVACDPTFCYPTYVIQNCENANAAEVRFYGWYEGEVEGESQATDIAGFAVRPLDMATFLAHIEWNPMPGQICIERSVNRGPWSTLATVAGLNGAYVDREVFKPGTLLKYRLLNSEQTTDAIAYRTMRRLDVSAGVIFANGSPYDANGNFERAFDGDLNTRLDIWGVNSPDYGNLKVGVDFGGPTNFIGCIRAYPRKDGSWDRLTGMTLYGSARDSETEKELSLSSAVALSPSLAKVQEGDWNLVMANDLDERAKAYRTYFVANMTNGGCGNIAELEFYGWSKSDVSKGFIVYVR